MKYLYFFLAVILVKFFLNLCKYLSACKLRDKYIDSRFNQKSFSEYIPASKKLFEDVGLRHASIPFVQALGLGKISSGHANVPDNLNNSSIALVEASVDLFDQTVGTYRMRMFEAFSPRYWIELVIFLPKHFVKYWGGAPDGIFAKLLQVIYWFATPILIAFRSYVYEFILTLLQ
jgi:hypothetical protein